MYGVGWKIIVRDAIIVLGVLVALFWFFRNLEPGDEVPLTPPESLYAPHGATQTIK